MRRVKSSRCSGDICLATGYIALRAAVEFTDRGYAVDITRAEHGYNCAAGAISPASVEADITGWYASRYYIVKSGLAPAVKTGFAGVKTALRAE